MRFLEKHRGRVYSVLVERKDKMKRVLRASRMGRKKAR